jgi:hypothetical protein
VNFIYVVVAKLSLFELVGGGRNYILLVLRVNNSDSIVLGYREARIVV